MQPLAINDLKELNDHHGDLCVSLYMPTYRAGADTLQNPVRLKNLLSRVHKTLAESDLWRRNEIESFLAPAAELERDRSFWQNSSDGLAIFLGRGQMMRTFQLPIAFEETCEIGPRFRLSPLFPAFTSNGKFFVLCLNQRDVRFFEATHHSLREVSPEAMPHSAEEIWPDRLDAGPRPIRALAANQYGRPGASHGHAAGDGSLNEDRERLLQLSRRIDHAIRPVLNGSKAPLVLAGVDSICTIYRDANTYGFLVESNIAGNPRDLSLDELRERAWKIVAPIFHNRRDQARERLEALAGTGRTTDELDRILRSAWHGGIETLFVASDRPVPGKFLEETERVVLNRGSSPDNEDLLNFAAIHTFLHGGEVFVGNARDLPGGQALSAIFRRGQEYVPSAATVSGTY